MPLLGCLGFRLVLVLVLEGCFDPSILDGVHVKESTQKVWIAQVFGELFAKPGSSIP